jgi:hypothetical protein
MGDRLTEAEVARFQAIGYHFPIPVFEPDEQAELRRQAERTRALIGGRFAGRMNQKPHLLFPWLNGLIRDRRIVAPVIDLLGPDLLCWGTQFFAKDAGDPSFVSWHQDATYWGLSSPDVLTAWLAFTPSTRRSGCMRVVPGTHLTQVGHRDTFAETNMLSRGQEVEVAVDEAAVVDITLAPGQMSLHHVLIIHGSDPNRAEQPRIGLAIRYVAGHVRQVKGVRDSATLIAGRDHGNFDLETPPEADLHPDARARHAAILDRQLSVLYAGAARPGKLNVNVETTA